MISFQMLNIILGLLAAAIIYFSLRFYLKKKNEILSLRQTGCLLLSLPATFLITFGLANIYLATPFQEWVLCTTVNRIPIMPAIKEYHPKQYKELMKKAKESVYQKQAPENFIAYSFIYVNQIFINDLKNAPDQAIYDYVIEVNQFYDTLFQHDPKLVIKMEKADTSLMKDLSNLLKDPDFKIIFDKALSAKKNIIAAATKNPSAPPPESTVRPLFNKIMTKLNAKYGTAVVNDTFTMGKIDLSPEIESKVIIDFYREMANMNKADVGELMRYIAFLSVRQNPI